MTPHFNILSLSGGGYMGLYTAHVLAALEERSGRPLRDSFDLVAGTSIGGILGLAVALAVPMRQVVDVFETNGTRIFSDRPAPSNLATLLLDLLRFTTRSKYDNVALRETISQMIAPDLCLRDLDARFIAPAVNLSKGIPVTFRTPHLADHTSSADLNAVDVALATSAAPTLLPIVRIGADYFCDGGIYANSPDHIALHEAEGLIGHPAQKISMLSIGTTTAEYSFPAPASTSFGLRQWSRNQLLIRLSLAAQQQSAHRILQQRLGPRYIRLDAAQDPRLAPNLGLDVATPNARNILRALAAQTADEMETTPGLDRMLAHSSEAPQFFPKPANPKPDPLLHRSRDFLARIIGM